MANQTVLLKKFLHLAPKIKTLMECCNCVSLAQRVKGVLNESFKENTTETFIALSQGVFSSYCKLSIGVKTKTSSWEGYKVAVFCTLAVSFRGEIKLNRLQIIAFQIYRNNSA